MTNEPNKMEKQEGETVGLTKELLDKILCPICHVSEKMMVVMPDPDTIKIKCLQCETEFSLDKVAGKKTEATFNSYYGV